MSVPTTIPPKDDKDNQPPQPPQPSDSGMGVGTIILIVLGSLAGLIGLVLLLWPKSELTEQERFQQSLLRESRDLTRKQIYDDYGSEGLRAYGYDFRKYRHRR